ncbi:MAG: hypothetical protein KatS3mg097_283 [Candidatus Parcubacteria bacterium]|nr:MAG: hypothetical protein KatS3mg097_283 [Candidatus Parcubacteria bacterium]
MINVYIIITKDRKLAELEINKISKKNILLSISKNNWQIFIDNLQKHLNLNILGAQENIVIYNIDLLNEKYIDQLVYLIKDAKKIIFFIANSQPLYLEDKIKKEKIPHKIINLHSITNNSANFAKYIKQFFNEHKIALTPKLLNFLQENYKNNIDLLINDLERFNFAIKNNNFNDIDKQIANFFTLIPNVFKIQDYFLSLQWTLFIHNFKKIIQTSSNQELLQLLSLIIHSLIKIYILKNSPNYKLRNSYFYIQKLKDKAQRLDNETLKKMIAALATTDAKFKKFAISKEEIPEDIVFNLLFNFRY